MATNDAESGLFELDERTLLAVRSPTAGALGEWQLVTQTQWDFINAQERLQKISIESFWPNVIGLADVVLIDGDVTKIRGSGPIRFVIPPVRANSNHSMIRHVV